MCGFVYILHIGHCEASEQYVIQLQDMLAHCAPKAGVAAFIAETIQVRDEHLTHTHTHPLIVVHVVIIL